MNMYAIFDLDGCIADDRHRTHLIDVSASDPWEAYHAACEGDGLMNAKYLHLARHCELIIFTSRPEKFRVKTQNWLRDVAKINPKRIYMRPTNSTESSPKLKANFLEQLLASGANLRDIEFAVDDRSDVLEVYDRYHIPAFKTSYPEGQLI